MTHVLHRSIGHDYPVAVSGDGIFIRDSSGKEYIDASSGAAVSCLGHSNAEVRAAMHAQLDKLAFAHTSFFTSEAAEELADDLVAHAPAGLDPRVLCQRRLGGGRGGAQARTAIFCRARRPKRKYLVARRQSYHGITLGALAIGGRAQQREKFAPLLIETHHVVAGLRISRAPRRTRRRRPTASGSRGSSKPRSTSSAAKT